MDKVQLDATQREPKRALAKLRGAGMVPAVLYGIGMDPVSVAVNSKEVEKIFSTHEGLNVLIDLKMAGGETVLSRIRDYNADPLKRNITHVDFQKIDLNRKIFAEVPLHFEGKSIGVKDFGGVLDIMRRHIEVRCLPTNVPNYIVVDVSVLNVGDNLHVSDVTFPEGVECIHESDFTIVAVAAPTKEEVVLAASTATEVPTTAQSEAKADDAAKAGDKAGKADKK